MKRLSFNSIKRLPMILQDEFAECAHACIAMISCFFGYTIDLHALRAIHNPSLKGMNLREIANLLEKLGFRTRALRVPINNIKLIQCPAILHWNHNHFVVLKRVRRNTIIIHDPAIGILHCKQDEFARSYGGVVLNVERSLEFKPLKDKQTLNLFDFLKTIVNGKKWLAMIFTLSLVLEILSLFNPFLIQLVTDRVLGANQLHYLIMLGFGFSILALFHVVVEYIRSHLILYITTNLTETFSANVMLHLIKLPVDFFYRRHKGDIQSKFQSIELIQRKISTDFINTLLDGLMMVVNLLFMFFFSQLLTSIVLIALIFYICLRYFSYQRLKEETSISIHQHAKTASIFLETIQAITPIKLFLKENLRFNTWRNGYIDALNADIKIAKMQILYQITNHLLFNIEHILVVCMGAKLVIDKQFSIGMLLAFLAYRLALVNKSASFIQNLFDYKLMSIQLDRIGDILLQKPEQIPLSLNETKHIQGHLTLHDLSFYYQTNEAIILNKINIDIRAGEKIVITGPSGCGKSTLLRIMLGLLEPTSGEINIDGIALRDFGLLNYRELTASVLQDDQLLSGSILDNITFFDEHYDMAHVYAVAKLACIHDTIQQLPMRYQTLVGEMGSILSGGQKQRILLARALYRKPKILFLDEATSHLDIYNEKQINQSLKSLAITQIVIAHRLETINMADRRIDLNHSSYSY